VNDVYDSLCSFGINVVREYPSGWQWTVGSRRNSVKEWDRQAIGLGGGGEGGSELQGAAEEALYGGLRDIPIRQKTIISWANRIAKGLDLSIVATMQRRVGCREQKVLALSVTKCDTLSQEHSHTGGFTAPGRFRFLCAHEFPCLYLRFASQPCSLCKLDPLQLAINIHQILQPSAPQPQHTAIAGSATCQHLETSDKPSGLGSDLRCLSLIYATLPS